VDVRWRAIRRCGDVPSCLGAVDVVGEEDES
jgi:hypothetical protein